MVSHWLISIIWRKINQCKTGFIFLYSIWANLRTNFLNQWPKISYLCSVEILSDTTFYLWRPRKQPCEEFYVSVFISKINCQKFAQKYAQNCLQSLISLIVLVFWNKTSNRYDSILRWIWTENGLFSLFKLPYSHTPILEMLSHLKIQ